MIIAVGYKIDTTPFINYFNDLLSDKENMESNEYDEKHNLTKNMNQIDSIILSGIYYNASCRGNYGIDARANEFVMKTWFSNRNGKSIYGFCDTIYIRHDSIIAKIYTSHNERFFCILYSTSSATSHYKHTICNGNYGGKVLNVDRIIVNIIPYIYER